MVSTIAVKRSNRAAALKAGRNGGQTNSTNFHLGQGEAGEEVSLSDSSFPALSSQTSADWVIPDTVAIFPASGRNRARFPVSGPIPGTVIPVCASGIGYVGKTRKVFLPGTSPNPSSTATVLQL